METKLLKKRIKLFSKIMQYKITGKKTPAVVYLLITDKCNMRCRYCFVDCNKTKKELTTDDWLKLIDDLYDMGTRMICLMGGEPLLHKDIETIINHILKKNIICDMTTNGLLIKNKIDVVKKVDSLMVSLDGNEISNDANRGNGTYKKIIEGIKTARKNNVVTRINCVLTKQNKDSIDYLLDLAEECDLYVTYAITAEFPKEFEKEEKEIVLTDPEIKDIYIKLKDLLTKGRRILLSMDSIDYVINYPLAYNKIIFKNDSKNINYYKYECLFGRTMLYIDANGDFYPCATLWNSPIFKPKNFLESGVKEAWNNMNGLQCHTCFCAGGPEWNYVTSLKGMYHGAKLTISQLLSKNKLSE